MTDRKKDFQKAIARIRSDLNKERRFGSDYCNYPKAMMTAPQERKNMGTVNCSMSRNTLSAVLEHPVFAEFLSKHPADVRVETRKVSGSSAWYEHLVRLVFKAR